MKVKTIKPEYVMQMPDKLDEGVLYICEDFNLTAHKCCCGCDEDVYNKLSPVKWQLIKLSGGKVSLEPSIGNWKYACKSHYWISGNRVIDAGPMSSSAIEAVQRRDLQDRNTYITEINGPRIGLWGRVRAFVTRIFHDLR